MAGGFSAMNANWQQQQQQKLGLAQQQFQNQMELRRQGESEKRSGQLGELTKSQIEEAKQKLDTSMDIDPDAALTMIDSFGSLSPEEKMAGKHLIESVKAGKTRGTMGDAILKQLMTINEARRLESIKNQNRISRSNSRTMATQFAALDKPLEAEEKYIADQLKEYKKVLSDPLKAVGGGVTQDMVDTLEEQLAEVQYDRARVAPVISGYKPDEPYTDDEMQSGGNLYNGIIERKNQRRAKNQPGKKEYSPVDMGLKNFLTTGADWLQGGGQKQGQMPLPDKYGFIVGQTKTAKGKTYRYVGNDNWEPVK